MRSYDPDHLSKDEAFDLMRDEQRRILVRLLLEASSEWDVEQLTEALLDQLSEPPNETKDEFRNRVLVTLMHEYLPRLADSGVITFNSTERTVVPVAPISDLAPLV